MVGDVTLRFWPVAELVVLASSEAEAEDALVSLLAHPDPAVRTAASARLDELHGTRAVAA
jgi:HEAT repeat protein